MTNLSAVLTWTSVLGLIHLASIPCATRLFNKAGKALWLPFFLSLWSYLYWMWGVSFGLPNLLFASWLSALLAWGILFWLSRKMPKGPSTDRKKPDRIFWYFLLSAIVLKGFLPSMEIAERYPDMMFFQSVFYDHHFPPTDRWLSGLPLNYYYFGVLLFTPLTHVTGIPLEWAFNLSVCTVAAMTASTAYGVVSLLSESKFSATLAAFASIFLSNWEWMRPKPFSWWDSSRAMGPSTITEFPFFSFLLGDFHAHYIALPWLSVSFGLVVLLKQAIDAEKREAAWVMGGLTALAVGLHYPLNPWEIPLASLLVAIILGRKILVTALVGIASFLFYLPFWISYERPVSSIGRVPAELHSPIGLFLLHWGLFLVPIFVIAGMYAKEIHWKRGLEVFGVAILSYFIGGWVIALFVLVAGIWFFSSKWRLSSPAHTLLLCAILSIAFCEFIHLDNLYGPDLRRMNTVFKFYTIAWWAFAISVPVILFEERERFLPLRKVWVLLGSFVVLFSLVYPYKAFFQRKEFGSEIPTLDGLMSWKKLFPGEREVVDWLRTNTKPEDILFEATGPAYGHFARFSAFSGRPSVLGWANHEGVWRRKGYDISGPRQADIDQLNKQPSAELLRTFVAKYGVSWILVGDLERKNYSPAFLDLASKLPEVYKTETTSVYKAN